MIAEELKHRVLLKTGLADITSSDCQRIAVEINKHLNKHVSVTTLKRVFGFAKSVHHFSKYTIAALSDYAGSDFFLSTQVSYISMSNLFADMKIRSFITEEGSCLSESADLICLHPNQLVLEGLEMLLKHDRECLPLVKKGKCAGMVYVKDLIYFLTCDDQKYGTLFHKFNFTLQTAIVVLHLK
jgi:hypothetical protein